jgi:hypothetical protein
MIAEEPGNLDRLRDAAKREDHDAFSVIAGDVLADCRRGIFSCCKCGARNRLKIDTRQEFERAAKHAVCGVCKSRLLSYVE